MGFIYHQIALLLFSIRLVIIDNFYFIFLGNPLIRLKCDEQNPTLQVRLLADEMAFRYSTISFLGFRSVPSHLFSPIN